MIWTPVGLAYRPVKLCILFAAALWMVGAALPATASAFQAAAPQIDEPVVPEDPREVAAAESAGTGDIAAEPARPLTPLWRPAVASVLGVTVILLLMIGLKAHAFVALIIGSIVISCFVPLDYLGRDPAGEPLYAETEDPTRIISRVNTELGMAVAKIGILIAMAAIIGQSMLDSGAADRIVQTIIGILGAHRGALALMVSGFVLGIPVFFDTVFFLLVPLARSLYRSTGKNYVKYLMAVAAGGAITHTLVPPTPGPLIVTETLNGANGVSIDLGMVIIIGLMVGFPSSVIGLLFANYVDRRMPIAMRPLAGEDEDAPRQLSVLPPFYVAILPVLLPVLLITVATVANLPLWDFGESKPAWLGWVNFFGDPSFALILAAVAAVTVSGVVQKRSLRQLAGDMDQALLSAGVIILITAAGGAFGAMLRHAEINLLVESMFEGEALTGVMLLVAAYIVSAALKLAQGSSTVAMMVASSLIAPLLANVNLGFHPAYFVPVIGAGSLMGSWMNDSGFWVYAKMGGLTEGETLRSWTLLLGVLSLSALLFSVILSQLVPMTAAG